MLRRDRGSFHETKIGCAILALLAAVAIPGVARAVRTERTRACAVAAAQAARSGTPASIACPVARKPYEARAANGIATVACPDTAGHAFRTPAVLELVRGRWVFRHELPPLALEPGQSIPIATGWAEHAAVSRDGDRYALDIEKSLLVRWVLGPIGLVAVAIATIALAEEWWSRKRGPRKAVALVGLVALNPLVVLPIAWLGASERIEVDDRGGALSIRRRSFGTELVQPVRLERVIGLALVGADECRVFALVERDDRCDARALFGVSGSEQDLRALSVIQRTVLSTGR